MHEKRLENQNKGGDVRCKTRGVLRHPPRGALCFVLSWKENQQKGVKCFMEKIRHIDGNCAVPEKKTERFECRLTGTTRQRLSMLAAADRVSMAREVELMINREWWMQCGSYMDSFIGD